MSQKLHLRTVSKVSVYPLSINCLSSNIVYLSILSLFVCEAKSIDFWSCFMLFRHRDVFFYRNMMNLSFVKNENYIPYYVVNNTRIRSASFRNTPKWSLIIRMFLERLLTVNRSKFNNLNFYKNLCIFFPNLFLYMFLIFYCLATTFFQL